MSRKIVFFDIDGTLWDFHMRIPESTREAIKRLRGAGNLAFINSGRTRAFINSEKLLSLGFDGIVSGCGTMIEWNAGGRSIGVKICPDDVLYYHRLPREICIRTGAGIVADSVPEKEFEECQNKAKAVVRAIHTAEGGLE